MYSASLLPHQTPLYPTRSLSGLKIMSLDMNKIRVSTSAKAYLESIRIDWPAIEALPAKVVEERRRRGPAERPVCQYGERYSLTLQCSVIGSHYVCFTPLAVVIARTPHISRSTHTRGLGSAMGWIDGPLCAPKRAPKRKQALHTQSVGPQALCAPPQRLSPLLAMPMPSVSDDKCMPPSRL